MELKSLHKIFTWILSSQRSWKKKRVMKRFEKAMKKIDQEWDPVIIAIQDVVFH